MSRKQILEMKAKRVNQTIVYDTTAEGVDITRKKGTDIVEHMSKIRIVIRDCKCENGCEKCNGLKKIITDLDKEPETFQDIITKSKRRVKRREKDMETGKEKVNDAIIHITKLKELANSINAEIVGYPDNALNVIIPETSDKKELYIMTPAHKPLLDNLKKAYELLEDHISKTKELAESGHESA